MPERKHTHARAHASEGAPAAVGSQCLCNFLLNILTRTAQFWQNAWDCVNQMVLGCSVFPTANSSGGRGANWALSPVLPAAHLGNKVEFSLDKNTHSSLPQLGGGTSHNRTRHHATVAHVANSRQERTPISPRPPAPRDTPTPRAPGQRTVLTTGRRRTCRRWGYSGRHPPSARS